MPASREAQALVSERGECSVPTKDVRYTIFIALRNALYAALLRILIGIIKLVGKKGLHPPVLRGIPGEVFSLDPLKWAFVFAGLSSFRLLKLCIMGLGQYVRVRESVSSILAGCFCALPALVMNKETQTDLSLYVFVRALHSFCAGHILPLLPCPLKEFNHYDILLMCLSSSQILYSFVFAPFTMPFSYRQFLLRASMLDDRLIRGYAGLVRHHATPELVEMCMEKGYALPVDPKEHLKISCLYCHPGMTCNQFCFLFLGKNMLKVGVPLYLPLKIITVLVFQRKVLLQKPSKAIRNIILSVFSSALFLALYSASSVRIACVAAQRNIRGGLFSATVSSLAGVATLLEPKGRRMDLALYCLMYAIRSFVLTQYRLGWLPYPRHSFVSLLYVLSVGYICSQYDQQPDKLNSRLRNIIAKIYGERPPPCNT